MAPYVMPAPKQVFVMTPPTRLLYPQKEAATLLGVSVRTVVYLISSGQLKSRMIGGRRLIPAQELIRFAKVDHPLEQAEDEAKPKRPKKATKPRP